MTTRRGQPWGRSGPAPPGIVRVHSDAELADLVTSSRAAGTTTPPVALLGGDLMRAVGGTGDERRLDSQVARLTVDVVQAKANGESRWFVAHLVARRSWWRGEVVAAMNAQHLGRWDVAPRSHPNDGRVDVLHMSTAMSLRDRWRARSRAVHAAHVPHPNIEVRSAASTTVEFARPLRLILDGRPWTSSSSIELIVEPDALTVYV